MNALGADGIAGTADDDLRLASGAPCIDAGDNTALPFDEFDLDGDGITDERIPFDIAGERRRRDDPDTTDTGYPRAAAALTDLGAHEYQPGNVLSDLNGDDAVGVADLLLLIGAWGPCSATPCLADIAPSGGNGVVNVFDLLLLLQQWTL